jgi:hypothetical protein
MEFPFDVAMALKSRSCLDLADRRNVAGNPKGRFIWLAVG